MQKNLMGFFGKTGDKKLNVKFKHVGSFSNISIKIWTFVVSNAQI